MSKITGGYMHPQLSFMKFYYACTVYAQLSIMQYKLLDQELVAYICVSSFNRDLFIPYIFATGGAMASAIALKETVVKVILL